MKGRYFFGIILIILGAGFLLEQLDIIYFGDIISLYWPSILILIGLSGLFDKKSSKFGNLIVIIVGIMLQVNKLDIIDINLWSFFFPILLILIGLKVVFSKNMNFSNSVSVNIGSDFKSNKNIILDDTIDEFAMLGGISTNNQSQQFKGGKVTAILGGVEIDLRAAKLNNGEGFLDITTIMGGVEVLVPNEWRVEVKGTPILGGWSNKAKNNTNPDAPLLKIKCFTMFGGMEVK